MTPADLLNRLGAEGVTVSLNLKLEADAQPSSETLDLIRENRHALMAHLKETNRYSNQSRVTDLHLPGILLRNLMLWTGKYHELRLELPPSIVTLNATPQQVVEASEAHPWGVVYDPDRHLLMSWGNVPHYALADKRDLETGELLIAEQVAA